MVDTVRLRGLATYLYQADQPINAAQVQEAAVYIDRLASELEQLRAESRMAYLHALVGLRGSAEDICNIPESAFPDYPARGDCQSGAAQRMAHDAIDAATNCPQCGMPPNMGHAAACGLFRTQPLNLR